MPSPAPLETLSTSGALDAIEAALGRGDRAAAMDALQAVLTARGVAGDAMAAAVDRLVALVREQQAQIAALRSLVETR